MSEIKRYDSYLRDGVVHFEEGPEGAWMPSDDVQSELAALREDLAETQQISQQEELRANEYATQLVAAEQRNAELTKAISDAEYRADQGKVWNGMGWTYTGLHSHGQQKVLDILRTAIKPTESGASE